MNEQDTLAFAEYIKSKGVYVVSVDARHNAWQAACEYKDRELAAMREHLDKNVKAEYDEFMDGEIEPDSVERLRFFCSLAMKNGQAWLDIEPFFDDVISELATLREQLAECQARNSNLIEVLSEAVGVCQAFSEISATANVCSIEGNRVLDVEQNRSALDAMLAKHAHDKLMAFAQVCESIGEDIHGPGRNDSEAYDCADAARLMAEEQLKP